MEIGRYFIEGMVGCYGVRPKCWVAAAVGAAVGLASTLIGSHESAKKEREARQKEAQSHARQQAYWNRKENESYADTASGQNMIRLAKDYADRNWKKAQGAAAVGGGTDAATAMAKESGTRMVGDTVAHMSAMDTARQDRAGAERMREDARYAATEAGHLRTQGANIANTASAMGNAAMSLGSALENTGSNAKADGVAPVAEGSEAPVSETTAAAKSVGAPVVKPDVNSPLIDGKSNSTVIMQDNLSKAMNGGQATMSKVGEDIEKQQKELRKRGVL
jgi:gas vesicle protein